MTHIEQAIGDAVDKGGRLDGKKKLDILPGALRVNPDTTALAYQNGENYERYNLPCIFLDPAFWQAVGKARGVG
jgi:hypothetical protein